jgi:hypothetical protein
MLDFCPEAASHRITIHGLNSGIRQLIGGKSIILFTTWPGTDLELLAFLTVQILGCFSNKHDHSRNLASIECHCLRVCGALFSYILLASMKWYLQPKNDHFNLPILDITPTSYILGIGREAS